eukprot:CAMPEP_0184865962 /NCGR_PEP_ID=MMETSP0580-20130426/20037_1 /TAXON_ID=1118495 /ORGANISM="Dactyliosolen fragilissimus" /LENGTH=427 /DNA_ID=CAMNT_0027365377 /DNA_START=36 /DNA_END=1316 /DNA_ORIENTATION=+
MEENFEEEEIDLDLTDQNVLSLNEKWDYNDEIEIFLRGLPKVELHVHLDGSFDPFLLFSHLRSTGNYDCLPKEVASPWDPTEKRCIRKRVQDCKDYHSFHSLVCCRGRRSLREMIHCFDIFIPVVRGNLPLLEKMAHDFVRRQSQQNIIYTEVRYSPHLLADGGSLTGKSPVDPNPVIDAVTKGLRQGEMEFGVKVNQILCCIAWRPDFADDVVRIAHERRNDFPCAVVGIDIAAGEEHFDQIHYKHLHEPHARALKYAQELKLNITIHAGEVGDPANIKCAVNQYGATRIGHGYQIIKDTDLLETLKKKNIHFEVCPTSSVETGAWQYDSGVGKNWKKHPISTMLQNGVRVGFNSDDPAVFNTSLTWQLRLALGKMGVTKNCIYESIINSIDASFTSDVEKIRFKEKLRSFMGKDDSSWSMSRNFI